MLGDLTEEYKIEVLKAIQNLKLDNEMLLHGGTMLGSIREQKLIDHDDDIDIAYISKYNNQKEVKKEMLEIYKKLINIGIMYKYFDLDYKEVFDFENLIEGRGQAHIMVCGLCIDLWTIWIDEDGDINYCDLEKVCKSKDFLPLKTSLLYGLKFKVSKNVEQLLEKIYGEDWTIPQDKKTVLETKTVLKENI